MIPDPFMNRPMTTARPMVLRVGHTEGDLLGDCDKVLQAAIDYLYRMGGGILQIASGTYTMRNALYMRPGISIKGNGEDTVLQKAQGTVTDLVQDADWYEARIRVKNPAGFSTGGGIMLRSYDEMGRMIVVKDTVTHIEGDILSLTRRLKENMWRSQKATAATLFPILTAESVDDIVVEDLVLDGNKEAHSEINGNYSGGIFIQYCDRHTYRNVISRSYNGDGFSFQVCDDVHFDRCISENNTNLGFHPGSGSQRPALTDCVSRHNGQGVFFCWGVSDGILENCTVSDNGYGITIGHRDTDNRIVNSRIVHNAKAGILFRDEGEGFLAGHRNVIESCLIRDNGFDEAGIGIDMRKEPQNVEIRDSRFEDTGSGKQKVGIRIDKGIRSEIIRNNTFHGLEYDIIDERT